MPVQSLSCTDAESRMSPRTLSNYQARSRMSSRGSRSRTPLPLIPSPGMEGRESGNGSRLDANALRPISATIQKAAGLDDCPGEAGLAGNECGGAGSCDNDPLGMKHSNILKVEQTEAQGGRPPRGSDLLVQPKGSRTTSPIPQGSGRLCAEEEDDDPPPLGGSDGGGARSSGGSRDVTPPAPREDVVEAKELSPLTLSLVDDLEGLDDVLMWVGHLTETPILNPKPSHQSRFEFIYLVLTSKGCSIPAVFIMSGIYSPSFQEVVYNMLGF